MYYHVQHVLVQVVASVLGENAIGKMHADVVVKWMTDDGKNQATRADGCTCTGPKSNFLSDQQNNRTSLRAPRRRAANAHRTGHRHTKRYGTKSLLASTSRKTGSHVL